MHRYSTALSHIFLAGIGIFCLNSCKNGPNWIQLPYISYGIIITNSIVGVWKWGNPLHGHRLEKIYYSTRSLQTLFVLPCIAAQLWMNHGSIEEFAYLHPIFSSVPLILHLKQKYKDKYIDLILGLNMLSCCWISFCVANWFGVASAFAYAINHFVLNVNNEIFDMPTIDFYNYALCFYAYFSVRALQGIAY